MSVSSNVSCSNPEFSVRIVVCDHYLSNPSPGIDVIYSDFRGTDIKQVPVLRIFGPTPDGHKACLHIHGVFPYFYIPCPTPNPEPQFLYRIAASIDKALNIALKQATSANQHVYKISLVKGLPFYGFHDKDHLYLKVFLYSPGLIKQAVELCCNGAILGQTFQPHESHLNFTLQFFIDFNLFGMSNIDLQSVKFRKSGFSQNSNHSKEPFDSPNEFGLKPESSCFYEADCIASHIINRQKIGRGDGIENPGLEEVWNQEMERRKQLNISLASKSLSQGRINTEETISHYKFEQMFLLKMTNLVDKSVITNNDLSKAVEVIHYPAESMEGSKIFNAVDISVHLPNNMFDVSLNENSRRDLDATLIDEADSDNTLVDENLALNSSLSIHYSQVLLNNEDLDLVVMLEDMDEKAIEEDSVLGTPANLNEEIDQADDAEYSQIFDEKTLYLNPYESKDDTSDSSPTWNDSFWDGANIQQLDGTCDDEHVKKVRKRKKRPFKLGLSRPKAKKLYSVNQLEEDTDFNDVDEINESREIVDNIPSLHLRNAIKVEPPSLLESSTPDKLRVINTDQLKMESITDLVNKVTVKHKKKQMNAAESYDLENKYKPMAGSSTNHAKSEIHNDNINYIKSSPDDNKMGIISFYDTSNILDMSLGNDKAKISLNDIAITEDGAIEMKCDNKVHKTSNNNETDGIEKINLDIPYTMNKHLAVKILTPKIRPPTKNYLISNLKLLNIPKIKNSEPYYSDHKDVGDKVEIGQMILKLHSKLSRDQKPFDNVLDTASIEEWRQLLFLQTNEIFQEPSKPDILISLLASNKKCILEPIKRPPIRKEVETWLAQNENVLYEEVKTDNTDLSKNVDELDNSQALGLIENEIDSSISLESNDKVKTMNTKYKKFKNKIRWSTTIKVLHITVIEGNHLITRLPNKKEGYIYFVYVTQEKTDLNNSLQVTMQSDGSFLCFGSNENQKKSSHLETPTIDVDFLTLMLAEIHTSVREDYHPDPTVDPIQAVFIQISNDCPPNHFLSRSITEIIVTDERIPKHLDRCTFDAPVTYVNNESEILERLIELVNTHDPDIMCGYEIEMNSWGYILERAQVLGMDIIKDISRITEKNRQKRWRNEENDFEGRIIGRVIFNVWRLFRHELALSSYSFENCMYVILKERVPTYSYAQLAEWWCDESRIFRWIPVEYYLTKLSGTVRMLEKLDIINRTSELARLFGLQWWEVLSRGSQFRVESLMLRAARPLNLVALSPTVKQRAAMRAPECLPLIFEPESRFYSDPVIVLDFQSLYPSIMIAYNYCFSTCIGRVQNINGDTAYEFGAWRLRISKSKLETLVKKGLVHWSPVGVGFVKSSVRRGVLPGLLRRILAARQAVKKSMKMQTDESLKKAMHSRQLGLKLIANVTYGYTAANFSGRMPCVEVGDSVVAKGRETLERAIQLVRNTTKWNAKVVYGDTDSMFVLVPGGTRAEAFDIGQQIADAVTADNPSPIALKLEKVYQPCILQTKKRYVGYMYESPDQQTPVYEAKGIETVRRDGCPAGVKLLQQSLCELFSHGDMSRVKRLVQATLARLAEGTMPGHELLFTREYHGAAGYKPGATAPPNEIAKRALSRDVRAAPRAGWRVSWQVTAGAPGAALGRRARAPRDLLRDAALRPHVAYYAARVLLPPLHRCLSLLGVDVFKWWSELGYSRTAQQREQYQTGGIARYMSRERCAVCGARVAAPVHAHAHAHAQSRAVCAACARTQHAAAALAARLATAETHLQYCYDICRSCCGHSQMAKCENTECPVLWRRHTAHQKLVQMQDIVTLTETNKQTYLDF